MQRFSYPLLFLLLVFILYSPILFAGFAGDDIYQLVHQPFFHEIKNVFAVFGQVIASPGERDFLTGFFYRPVTYVVYTVLYVLFPGQALPFHLLQLILYGVACFLLFLFFKGFFSKKIALLLAGIFLIHPANNELVAYIAALSDTLSLVFGISALIIIGRKKRQTVSSTVIICLLLLLSLFSKETGIVFVFLVGVYAACKKQFPQMILPLVTTTVLYILFRANASSNVMFTYLPHPVTNMNIPGHIFLSVQIAAAFIREIVVPTRDAIKPGFFQLTPLHTALSGGMLALFLGLCSGLFFWIRKHKAKYLYPFLFFFSWVVGGMVFFLQIIPLEVLFAERWLYIAEIGILGLFGILISTVKLPKTKWVTAIYILFVVLILCYVAETFILNTMWLNWEQHFHNL